MYIYPTDPEYNTLKSQCRRSHSNFATHKGIIYERVSQADPPYFVATGIAPDPDISDRSIDPSMYYTGFLDDQD